MGRTGIHVTGILVLPYKRKKYITFGPVLGSFDRLYFPTVSMGVHLTSRDLLMGSCDLKMSNDALWNLWVGSTVPCSRAVDLWYHAKYAGLYA